MDLQKIIRKECCTMLHESRKTEVLLELLDLIGQTGLIEDMENLKKEIFYREQLMSTGIGLGIGIPHVRFGQIGEPIAAVGVQPKGIKDYESIDDEAVRIVIMIIVGRNQHKEHIRLLSLIVGRLKQEGVKDSLLRAENPQQIHTIVTGSTP
ncbi:MAG TPA: PTS sugar transporter subunit IIA [Spirochaetia bacterium]|nr:PTS sugar transporter subunit IIA [Spirochaetia bacterium]